MTNLPPPTPADMASRWEQFGRKVLSEARDEFGDLDGGWIQDTAEKCGLLVRVPVAEPCGENCRCAEYDDFPQECLRLIEGSHDR